ncbi:MAG TPA: response regulator [Caldilineaceae bacterium]|nr:response regulator [Caldilineaceae bacterium]
MHSSADLPVQHQSKAPRILVIDDDPRVQDTIEAQLYSEGYELFFKSSGIDAIRELNKVQPDVILLDLMMPGMNGFDVCSHIKHNEEFRHVPVIMVTALDDVDYLVTGLETGADEFIAKPVNGAELRARVRSMLRIKHQYDELGQAIQTRDIISRMIVHDMRNPLSSILLYSQVIQRKQKLPPEQIAQVVQIQNEALRLGKLFDDMLVLSRMQRGEIILQQQDVDLAALVAAQHGKLQSVAAGNDVTLLMQLEEALPLVSLDAPLIERLVETLITNAFKFAPPQSQVKVLLTLCDGASTSAAAAKPSLQFQVIDQGPEVPADIFDNILQHLESERASQSQRPATELGLAFCKMVATAHGGTIRVSPNHPAGAIFTVNLPFGL